MFYDREKLLKVKAEDQEFAKILRSPEQFIQSVKGQNNFWYSEYFLTCSWRFLTSNKLEQLKLKFEKIIGISKHARKVRKSFTFVVVVDSTAAVVAAVLGSYDEILVDQPAVPPREVVNLIS